MNTHRLLHGSPIGGKLALKRDEFGCRVQRRAVSDNVVVQRKGVHELLKPAHWSSRAMVCPWLRRNADRSVCVRQLYAQRLHERWWQLLQRGWSSGGHVRRLRVREGCANIWGEREANVCAGVR